MELAARLRAFAGFVRRGSFSGAAEELRISQPAVSKHIADIEHALGVKLIERHSRQLTAAGEFLARHVLRAEAILGQAVLGIAALQKSESGTLSIMASGTSGTYLLPEAVAAFHQAHPNVRITFALGTSAEVVNAVRTHRAEIGVVGGLVAAPEIEAEPWLQDEIVIVGPPSTARRLSRGELESLTWISREEGSATSLLADAALGNLGIVPHHRLVLPSWEAIKLAVSRGYGIAAFSRLAVTDELDAGTLVLIPLRLWKVQRTFSVIRIRDATLTAAAQQFVLSLHARLRTGFEMGRANGEPRRRMKDRPLARTRLGKT
jgi:DNA-binding transcriptional LysR family regulator